MKKSMILGGLLALLMCSCTLINSRKDLNRIEKVNTICPGITSTDEAVSRKAVRKCKSKEVLMATLYYHPDFGTRLEVAKMCRNREMLKKARVFAKKAEPKGGSQEELHAELLETLNKKLKKKRKSYSIDDLSLANDFEEKAFTAEQVIKMEDFNELVNIFLYYSDFELKLLALERVYGILSFIPKDMSAKEAASKIRSAKEDIKGIIKRFFPVFVKMEASSERQERYKKDFLTEVQRIFDTLDPEPGQEAYIDRGTFLRGINALRKENGLAPIKYDDRLNSAALEWAKYHHENHLPVLKREDGENSFADKIAGEGYDCLSSSANLSITILPNAESLLAEWSEESEERDNMLGEVKNMGLACIYAPLKKKNAYACVLLLAEPAE